MGSPLPVSFGKRIWMRWEALMRIALPGAAGPVIKESLGRDAFYLLAEPVHVDIHIIASWVLSAELHSASVTRMTRNPQSMAPSMVASTQTSVSPPVMTDGVHSSFAPAAVQVRPGPGRVDMLVKRTRPAGRTARVPGSRPTNSVPSGRSSSIPSAHNSAATCRRPGRALRLG